MVQAKTSGYRKKNRSQLLQAIDECTSLSQLFALIQHEEIAIQMHAQSGASNLTPKKLTVQDLAKDKNFPLDRLKTEVKKAVWNCCDITQNREEDTELIKAIRKTKSLNELFTLIKQEKITIQMHAQSGASNLALKKLEPRIIIDTNDSPFERLKSEVIQSVSKQQE